MPLLYKKKSHITPLFLGFNCRSSAWLAFRLQIYPGWSDHLVAPVLFSPILCTLVHLYCVRRVGTITEKTRARRLLVDFLQKSRVNGGRMSLRSCCLAAAWENVGGYPPAGYGKPRWGLPQPAPPHPRGPCRSRSRVPGMFPGSGKYRGCIYFPPACYAKISGLLSRSGCFICLRAHAHARNPQKHEKDAKNKKLYKKLYITKRAAQCAALF